MAMEQYLYLIPLLPLLAFAINLLFGRFLRTAAHWIATPAVFASFLLSLLVFRQISATGEPLRQDLYTWIQSGTFHIGINLFVDQLTAVMLIVVTSVGFLVHVYSKGYMQGDPGFARFFAYLPFFVFSMLMLVLADNFLLLFFFWEGVGLASYLLIGFWFTRRSAAGAAQKAFIVNRIGDLAFGLGLIWIFYQFGTLDFREVFAQVPAAPVAVVTGIALLLFGGAAGKSAQFPLHVWLPDAMEGPTPVSALIHAATMVTAGIYLIVRTHTFYESAPTAMLVVALIGAFTSFMAATIAVAQNDIKRVVAYSTLSQLGYMAMGAGVGAFIPAIFHLVTHAFFKGCLFLGAGSVIHGMHEEQNIQRMGGLRRWMPVTFWTFLAASFANAGMIPFAGFWSKDEILLDASLHYTIIYVLLSIAAFFTAFYMGRQIWMVFFGEPRHEAAAHAQESPPVMTVPLMVLAFLSIVGGALNLPFEGFHNLGHWLEHTLHEVESLPLNLGVAGISTVLALAAIYVSWLIYGRNPLKRGEIDPLKRRLGGIFTGAENKWYVDELYNAIIVRPFVGISRFLADVIDWRFWHDWFHETVVAGSYNWLSKIALDRYADQRGIDATANNLASITQWLSVTLRRIQNGFVRSYALSVLLGVVLIVGYLILK